MECSIPIFPEIKAPLFFKKTLTWEKRREGLHIMFSSMFQEFTRECFFSPLLISFFGGDISNVNITESPNGLSPTVSLMPPPTQATTSVEPNDSRTTSKDMRALIGARAEEQPEALATKIQKPVTKATASTLDMSIDMQGELWYQNSQTNKGTAGDQWKKRYFSTDSKGDKAQLYMWKDESKEILLNSLDLVNFKVEHKAQPTMSMLGLGSKTPASMILIGEEQGRQEIIFRGKSNHEVTLEYLQNKAF